MFKISFHELLKILIIKMFAVLEEKFPFLVHQKPLKIVSLKIWNIHNDQIVINTQCSSVGFLITWIFPPYHLEEEKQCSYFFIFFKKMFSFCPDLGVWDVNALILITLITLLRISFSVQIQTYLKYVITDVWTHSL